jgi:acetyltransferase-like isoleucine patch superfamily enzyme
VLSAEHRESLVARARAELSLRLARLRREKIEWAGKPLFHEGWPIFDAKGKIVLGIDTRLRGGPVRIQLVARPSARIELGDYVGMGFGSEITAAHLVTIGDHTRIGPMVTIYDTSFHSVDEGEEVKSGPVKIGRNVWIGRQAMIFAGVSIGDHSVVASGAVVTRDVPPRTVVAGNPAKVVREVIASDGWSRG